MATRGRRKVDSAREALTMAALAAKVEALTAEVAQLRSRHGGPDVEPVAPDEPVTRRALLGRIGGAAAAGVGLAAAGSVLSPRTAAANDPNDVVIGVNLTNATVELHRQGSGDALVTSTQSGHVPVDGLSGPDPGLGTPAAGIRGRSSSADGVLGLSSAANGVQGKTSLGPAAGVYGSNTDTASASGWGVFGTTLGRSGIVQGRAAVAGDSGNAEGVIGTSLNKSGVHGVYRAHSGYSIVPAGVWGDSSQGSGIAGTSLVANGVQGETVAAQAAGVYGKNGNAASNDGWGVYGTTDNPTGRINDLGRAGVAGDSRDDYGVMGVSTNSDGVLGYSLGRGAGVTGVGTAAGAGVSAYGDVGPALVALTLSPLAVDVLSNLVGVRVSGSTQLELVPTNRTGAPTENPHKRGQITLDQNGDIYVCTAPGSPGTWQKVAYGSGGGGGGFTPIDPTRIVDTRSGELPDPPGEHKLAAGEELIVPIRGAAGVPQTATAVVLNVTAVFPTAAGFLSLYPASQTYTPGSPPSFSNVNFVAGDTAVPNLAAVKLATTGPNSGAIKVYNSHGETHVVLDVAGFYS